MDIQNILSRIDKYYSENKGAEAEQLMLCSIEETELAGDKEGKLQLLNELLGYYRETSRIEDSFRIAKQAIATAEDMGLKDTLPYATTILNVANAYRAGGRLTDSLECYLQVRSIYDRLLSDDNILVASLENNISLLYQEMGDFVRAKESLEKALIIVEKKYVKFEIAVTHANLATTCIQLGELEEGRRHAQTAIEGFREQEVADAHYGAALSALGTYYYQTGDYAEAGELFRQAMEIMEQNLGRNEYYYRLKENYEASRSKADDRKETASEETVKGLALSRQYYEAHVRPMLKEKFPEYVGKIAVGLAGEGSDCFGYDDNLSEDHDWGPDVCLWVTEATYEQIGPTLEKAYEELPEEFKGYRRTYSSQGKGRRGVNRIGAFYKRLLGAENYEEIDFAQVSDAALAAAVNGEVFRDDEGIFSAFRKRLQQGYPESIRYRKMAQSGAMFSQCAQYNYSRMLKRGDRLTANMMLNDGMKEAMKLLHYVEGKYPPHDKWLRRSLQDLESGKQLERLLQEMSSIAAGNLQEESAEGAVNRLDNRIEAVGDFLARKMYACHIISDINSYLDAHTEELLQKSHYADATKEMLVKAIANREFEAFDRVQNVGGRASCQNDWGTFSIMRKSQYLTWDKVMLLQYLYDFEREDKLGHNLITEKYGRMMESTAREEYEQLKDYFPEISPEKKAIIEEIVAVQVKWMEEFAAKYPKLAGNARSIHTKSDHLYNTSYETYLRGEISTYSDKMLELYGRLVVCYMKQEKNLAYDTMENSIRLYGYKSMEEAEKTLSDADSNRH
ncbi:MAG: DUF4125 family protein [Lachnospiraceae bacterium]|nr:DUF4125 family protein [Lachnospiraceae bacterium]